MPKISGFKIECPACGCRMVVDDEEGNILASRAPAAGAPIPDEHPVEDDDEHPVEDDATEGDDEHPVEDEPSGDAWLDDLLN